jgi:nicotinate dehydrogenase subunit B
MNLMMPTRRDFTAGLGSIIVSFSLDPKLAFAQQAAKLPGSLAENRMLDAWIRINADGSATIFPGKVELGQGITTALTQIAAEELDLPLARVRVLTTDTTRSPNEGFTSGSQSIEYGGTALRLASAEVRAILLDLAAKRLGVAADMLTVTDGTIGSPDGHNIGYGELAASICIARRRRRSLPSHLRPIRSSGNRFRVSISQTR